MKNRCAHSVLRRFYCHSSPLVFRLERGRQSPGTKTDVLLSSMQEELQRAQFSLGKLDPAPYFLSYSVYDQSSRRSGWEPGQPGEFDAGAASHRRRHHANRDSQRSTIRTQQNRASAT